MQLRQQLATGLTLEGISQFKKSSGAYSKKDKINMKNKFNQLKQMQSITQL